MTLQKKSANDYSDPLLRRLEHYDLTTWYFTGFEILLDSKLQGCG